MTAEDAKFAIDYTLEPKNAAFGFEALALVDRAEVADPHTLRIQLKQPSAAFLSIVTSIKPFSVIPKGSLEEAVDKPPAFPPGTGPFIMAAAPSKPSAGVPASALRNVRRPSVIWSGLKCMR